MEGHTSERPAKRPLFRFFLLDDSILEPRLIGLFILFQDLEGSIQSVLLPRCLGRLIVRQVGIHDGCGVHGTKGDGVRHILLQKLEL